MKPTVAELADSMPDVDRRLVEHHVTRLPDRYFERFQIPEIAAHLRGLQELDKPETVRVLGHSLDGGLATCTVLSFDAPSLFSIVTGLLSSVGAEIVSGDVFTYRPSAGKRPVSRPRMRRRTARRRIDPLVRRRIVDQFVVVPPGGTRPEEWLETFGERVRQATVILADGGKDASTRARAYVNELVAERLSETATTTPPALPPVKLEVNPGRGEHTELIVESEDTPMFLYALSTALALRSIAIEGVRIRTIEGHVKDEIDIVDAAGRAIADPDVLDRVRLSVLLTKQFTHFLGSAPDPYAALSRFEQIVDNALRLPEQGKWRELLANPRIQQDLARLLGASDFMWEDFVRQQYEALLPMLSPEARQEGYYSLADLPARLRKDLEEVEDYQDFRDRLNRFKDREIFLIDLDHILNPEVNFRVLSERLTCLAEAIVAAAAERTFAHLARRYGVPRTVAGLAATYAVFGLGKLGGAALGYASDIELLIVFSDSGRTDGQEAIANCEFFDRLVEEFRLSIRAKSDGIFDVDLRLRPFGDSGPLAVSLENFCSYYGRGGPAHSYERLALVRLRHLAGDNELGRRVERLRDDFVYQAREIKPSELRALRQRQYREKNEPGRLNAKFSPGALVDLEYDVQLLQVLHGAELPSLRSPRVHEALSAMAREGVILPNEASRIAEAYDFLRQLINGLRMLRGTAKDLFLPSPDAAEYAHLARRMGYRKKGELTAAQCLHLDFETHTAAVRAFVQKHFGRDSIPGPSTATVADLILSDDPPKEAAHGTLAAAGFTQPDRALLNLRNLAGADRKGLFARLAVLACDILKQQPDADMALNNWERFVQVAGNAGDHFRAMLAQPKRLDILLAIFSGSQFLADTLVRNPEFLDWVTDSERLHRERLRKDIIGTFRELAEKDLAYPDFLEGVRVLYRRELLRIGSRDICLKAPTLEITREISAVAEGIATVTLDKIWDMSDDSSGHNPLRERFCILAFGKLGGRELNYSSDIDVLGLYEPSGSSSADPDIADRERRACEDVLEKWRHALTAHTKEGHVYRVDFRLRPYGGAGRLVLARPSLDRYYRHEAALWEIQALIKAAPIAGNRDVGQGFLDGVHDVMTRPRQPTKVAESIRHLRKLAVARTLRQGTRIHDVKNGRGGIRDVEFLVQGLQLVNAQAYPDILDRNTVSALDRLVEFGILTAEQGRRLADDYLFLRRVEHFLQMFENLQVHAIPGSEAHQEALARRLFGHGAKRQQLLDQLVECQQRVRAAYESLLP